MAHPYAKLFEPIQVGKLKIKNRTSMAPMGLVARADGDGGFSETTQAYYVERAKGGVGLIITGICSVNYNEILDRGLPCPTHNPLMFNVSTAEMNEKIHAQDSKIFLQLTGGLGRSAIPDLVKTNYAPSDDTNRFAPQVPHRAMTIEEIKGLIADFAKSAAIGKKCGFDGVEVHAVHEGYLLDQFAISCYNRRTDEYGGDLRGRLKIATDIVAAIKKVCGEDYPVSLRFSVKSFMKGLRQGALPGEEFEEYGKDLEEGLEAAKILVEAGYDMLNVDVGTYDSWYWNHPPMYFEKGMYRDYARKVKEVVDVPIILAGRMDDPQMAVDAIDDCCDIISYGRPLLADAYLVEKIRKMETDDIRPCLSCHDGCMGRIAHGLPLSCAVNPVCGRENVYGISPAMDKKKVLIIGGGLAGMESARVCALRGHTVTLMEGSDKLGGQILPGSVPDFKKDDRQLIKWYEKQIKDAGVEIKMNTRADAALVQNFGADAVIIATGSTPINIDLGSGTPVVSAEDVLLGKKEVGENVVFIGGGLVGCETALWLQNQGKKTAIVEMLPMICGGPHNMPFMNWDMLKDLLIYNKVNLLTSSKVKSIGDNQVVVETPNGEKNLPADTVVLAVGYKSNSALYDELNKNLEVPLYNLGDSREVHNIMSAIWDAYEVARSI